MQTAKARSPTKKTGVHEALVGGKDAAVRTSIFGFGQWYQAEDRKIPKPLLRPMRARSLLEANSEELSDNIGVILRNLEARVPLRRGSTLCSTTPSLTPTMTTPAPSSSNTALSQEIQQGVRIFTDAAAVVSDFAGGIPNVPDLVRDVPTLVNDIVIEVHECSMWGMICCQWRKKVKQQLPPPSLPQPLPPPLPPVVAPLPLTAAAQPANAAATPPK